MSLPSTSIVVFCGLPGAGKSTTCRKLQAELASDDVKVALVSYDDIEQCLSNGSGWTTELWHRARFEVHIPFTSIYVWRPFLKLQSY